jgi:hypothetical protein
MALEKGSKASAMRLCDAEKTDGYLKMPPGQSQI